MPTASSAVQLGSQATSPPGTSEAGLGQDAGYDLDPQALAEDVLLEQLFFAPVKQRGRKVILSPSSRQTATPHKCLRTLQLLPASQCDSRLASVEQVLQEAAGTRTICICLWLIFMQGRLQWGRAQCAEAMREGHAQLPRSTLCRAHVRLNYASAGRSSEAAAHDTGCTGCHCLATSSPNSLPAAAAPEAAGIATCWATVST